MEYYSAIKKKKSAFESVLMRWMNLEPIIQSEVSQREKNKYHILMHRYVIQKDGTNEPICRATMETDIENRLMDMAGGEKARVRGMERVIGKYTLPYVKQIVNKSLAV